MLVSTCTHRNWECRDRFSKRVWFVVTSKAPSVILLSYSVSDIKDAIRDGEMAETEIEILFLGQGRGSKPNQRPFQNASPGFTLLLLSSALSVWKSKSAEQTWNGTQGHCQKGQEVGIIFHHLCFSGRVPWHKLSGTAMPSNLPCHLLCPAQPSSGHEDSLNQIN